MSGDDLPPGNTFQLFEALGTPEPSRVVPSQPALRNTITPLWSVLVRALRGQSHPSYILNHMAMVTDEEESPSLGHVNLHPNQTISMAGQMMQSDTLTEVHSLIIERLPVPEDVLVALDQNNIASVDTYKDSFR